MADRVCRTCGQTKFLDDFYENNNGKPKTRCKKCDIADNRVVQLRNWYGLTPGDYQTLLDFQDHKCPCCGREFTETGETKPHVDHEHDTHKTRGILCNSCNSILGRVNDSTDTLRKMVQYLLLPPADELWDEDKVGLRPRHRSRGVGGYQAREG